MASRATGGRPSGAGDAVKQHHRYACTGEAPQGSQVRADIGLKKANSGKPKASRKTRGR
jgi:hypothetical protein